MKIITREKEMAMLLQAMIQTRVMFCWETVKRIGSEHSSKFLPCCTDGVVTSSRPKFFTSGSSVNSPFHGVVFLSSYWFTSSGLAVLILGGILARIFSRSDILNLWLMQNLPRFFRGRLTHSK